MDQRLVDRLRLMMNLDQDEASDDEIRKVMKDTLTEALARLGLATDQFWDDVRDVYVGFAGRMITWLRRRFGRS